MLAAPSLQNEYTLCFSGDDALDLPAVPPEDDANHGAATRRTTTGQQSRRRA